MDVVTVQLSFMTYKHVQADTSLVKVLRANVLFKQTHTFLYISLSKMALTKYQPIILIYYKCMLIHKKLPYYLLCH